MLHAFHGRGRSKKHPKMSKAQQAKMGEVMREFHAGKLRAGSGHMVTDLKQAQAIAASVAKKKA